MQQQEKNESNVFDKNVPADIVDEKVTKSKKTQIHWEKFFKRMQIVGSVMSGIITLMKLLQQLGLLPWH